MSTARREAVRETTADDVADWWSTDISDIEPGVIRLRGYPIEDLIGGAGLVRTIWMMVRGELPTNEQASLLEKALVAAVDHGPQAPSIAAARMAATCGVGLQGAMSTGVGMLGDVHGGAGQQCMQLLVAIEAASESSDIVGAVGASLSEFRRTGRHVPGFGHRFHPRDPRRDPLLHAVADQAARGLVSGRYLAVAEELERQLAARCSRPVPLNIDGATAVVYSELGFPPELGRGLFVLSRSVGILAHSWEESQSGRRIKGPIPPPLLPTYRGHPEREVPRR
ncbi:citryl-CoA lyase [Nocardia vermiculata]|uniref:citrate synthase (unknown stereospecificity) n=1 Tax=Nocardia vermiculata TaxID=257274 RepID=A0A846XPA3_9NOCA|nr:citryl-CoA lyase [Nocardia vermiculata]NKY48863.1 citryl-CoA lyase [Nocardia vermiculata]